MSMIAPQVIEQIAAANDIVEVIGSYFPLKRVGLNFRALCPFHQEKSPSFYISHQRQSYHCFGCGVGGSVFRFVMSYENIDFPTAVRKLAQRVGIPIIEAELSAEDNQKYQLRRRLLALHQDTANWFHEILLKKESKKAREYLKSRGLTREIVDSWKIGCAPDSWNSFTLWATEQGYNQEEVMQSGLVKLRDEENGKENFSNFYDRFRKRIMFPICNDFGEVIAFSGRVIDAEVEGAKYINSPETILFTKGNILFGLHKSKRALIDKGFAIVCEGQLDLITAFEGGVENVIAPQGTAFTEKQARILKRYVEEVVLCFDSDNAGQKATERSLASLLEANLLVRVAEMPAGYDPDLLIREKGAAAFIQQITDAKDFFDFQIDKQTGAPDFSSTRGKMQFAKKMAESVGLIGDPVMKETFINKVSARLEISPQDFGAMLIKSKKIFDTNETRKIAVKPNETICLLCLLSLRSSEARNWLKGIEWKKLLSINSEAGLLAKILEADLRPDESNSISTFMAGLDAEEESLVSLLLLNKLPDNAGLVVRDCWNDLQRREIKRRQETVTNRLRMPDLTMEQIISLQKEILDLQRQLTDIARPSSLYL